MSLRLDYSKLLDGAALPRHPFNGIEALGVLPSGRIVWPIAGAADDDGGDDDKDGKEDDDAGDGGSSDDNGDGGSTGGDPADKSNANQSVSREEFDKLFSRMQAADRRATDAEKQLRQLTDKDKSELEKAQRDLSEVTAERDSLKNSVRETAIRLAFLMHGSHITWHDPEDALQFAMRELKDVEVSDEGTVDRSRVKSVADKLAKEKKYLVKSSTDSGGGDGKDDDKDGKDGKQPSGDSMNGGRDKDKRKLDREKLAEKYPALRR